MHCEVCARVNNATRKPFRVSMGLRQGCSFLPILFLIYMDRVVKKSEFRGGVKIGECTAQLLLFADDLVLLDSTQNGLQQALDGFLDACSVAGMKISTTKTNHAPVHITRAVLSPNWWRSHRNSSITAFHSQVMADKIANWISASKKQVQECASSTNLWY